MLGDAGQGVVALGQRYRAWAHAPGFGAQGALGKAVRRRVREANGALMIIGCAGGSTGKVSATQSDADSRPREETACQRARIRSRYI